MLTKTELAQDVLNQLDARKFVAQQGWFWVEVDRYSDEDAREFMRKQEHCHVCARGALFLAALEKKNKLTCDRINFSSDFMSNYVECFSQKELYEIEAFFELYPYRFSVHNEYDFVEKCDESIKYMRGETKTAEQRLRAIMENIIKYEEFDRFAYMKDNPV